MPSTKIAFIHGRPGNPVHIKYATSTNADLFPVDFYLRWHDKPNSTAFRRYLSWLLCALFFPNKKKYTIFYTECVRFPVVLMRWLGLLSKKQKIVALLDDETMYFIYSKKYSGTTSIAMKKYLQSCDALICVGKMQTELAKNILQENCPPLYTIFNGVDNSRAKQLLTLSPSLLSKNIILIANVDVEWRAWYKGTDIMFRAFEIASKVIPDIQFTLVGRWDTELLKAQIAQYCPKFGKNIIHVGYTDKLDTFINDSSLYLHCARGEAWGISVTEAMASGIPTIVSEWTGAKDVVEQVDESLIVSLNEKEIADKIIWYFNLPLEEKKKLSDKCREVVKEYTEENAVSFHQEKFAELVKDFGLIKN